MHLNGQKNLLKIEIQQRNVETNHMHQLLNEAFVYENYPDILIDEF